MALLLLRVLRDNRLHVVLTILLTATTLHTHSMLLTTTTIPSPQRLVDTAIRVLSGLR